MHLARKRLAPGTRKAAPTGGQLWISPSRDVTATYGCSL